MKNIILAWLNANATNDAKAKEIEYHCEKFAVGFAEWLQDNCWNIEYDRYLYEDDQYKTNQLLEIYKKIL